mmetsp:Transcript_71793/g.114275  ORF Transcript_71793/g.114275 Transcript_71793/m.114275 type:complete len:721 (+) Transcript_71793:179-2341(+)
MPELKVSEEYDEEDYNLDTSDIDTIPSIEELRKRDDVRVTELLDYVDRYQQKFESIEAVLVKLRESKRANVQKHRGSVIDLHNRMFKKLIDTEHEQKSELEIAQERVRDLGAELAKLKVSYAATGQHADDMDEAERFKVSQIQKYIDDNTRLQKEKDSLSNKLKETEHLLEVEQMKQEKTTDAHRKSISTLHTNMFRKLLDAEDDFEERIERLQEEVSQKNKLLQMEKMKNEHSDKLRRDSIQTVHNNMLAKLLDAQAEHDEKEEKLQNEIKELKAQLRKEILRNEARWERQAESGAYNDDNNENDRSDAKDNDNASDVSDLETEQETRVSTAKAAKFDDLWDEADEPEAEIDRLKAHIAKIESELKEEKEKNVFIEKQRKDSIHNLHNNMFQKLLDAEFEYEEEIERLHREKEELNEKIAFYEDAFAKMNAGQSGAGQPQSMVNPTEIVELKEDIKQKEEVIEQSKQRIFHLTTKLEELEVKLQNEQKQRRGSVSFLSQQMMAKLLDAEQENEEQKSKFKDKLQRLEKELEESKENAFNLEKTRRNSVTKVSQTMFSKLLQAEQTKKQMIESYEARIKELEQKLAVHELEQATVHSKHEMNSMEVEKYKSKAKELEMTVIEIKKDTESKERQRRESFSQLQNQYWKKLLEAEDDYEVQISKLKHEIVRLQAEITNLQKSVEVLTASKLNLIMECNKQMNDLRTAVTVYNKRTGSSASWF